MNKKVGLWLDHNKAVIVSISDTGEERKRIISGMEDFLHFSGNRPGNSSAKDARDPRFLNHLNGYYDQVIAHIGDAKSILIFGPGEAKYELKKRLEDEGMLENIVSIDDADNGLTDRQVAQRVRERFPARSLFDIF